jgi:CheY-like chemotaxis protein
MKKRVLDVGNCGPDHAAIKRLMGRFGAEVVQADGAADALAAIRAGGIDLVLVNRKLDMDYSDGIEVIRQIKADPEFAGTPVMLITNYPEHQDAAEQLGALRGFGKLEYDKPETQERITAAFSQSKLPDLPADAS